MKPNLIRTDTRMTKEMKAALDKEAKKRNLNFSDIVRAAVLDWLKRNNIKWAA